MKIDPKNLHWFDDFFDSIYQFTGILDKNGRVLRANHAILNMTGLSQSDITGVPLWEMPWSALSSQNRLTLKQAFDQASQGSFVRQELVVKKGGRVKQTIDFSLKPIYDDNQEIILIVADGQDVTAHKRTRDALFRSEARFQTIFEETGVGIVIKSVDGKILDTNPAFQAMLGYTSEELKLRGYLDVTHPLDKANSQEVFDGLVTGKHKSYSLEKRYIHNDGQIVWGNITCSLVLGLDGQAQFAIGIVENITAQKLIEAELSELRHRLMFGREMERLGIAQDLHDGPLQEIIGISYQLQALENSMTTKADIEQLQSIQGALHLLAKSLRVICGELRPPTLIPFGLKRTILSHIDEIQTAHPELEIIQDLPPDSQSLPEQQRIVLFRIYQEALRNILQHSQATKVWVHLWIHEEQAVLEIKDNGVGFDPPRRWIEFARRGHLGMVGAMERAKEAGGSLEITSAAGQGTLIRTTVPLVVDENNQKQTMQGSDKP